MDLTKILAVSGHPGLYRLIGQSPKGMVAESLLTEKKITLFAHERISALEEISIFTTENDLHLKDALKILFEKLEGKPAISHKSSANELKLFMENMIPNYDQERVYNSDIQKLISWYNLLLEKQLLDFSAEEEQQQEEQPVVEEDKKQDKKTVKTEKKVKAPQSKSTVAKTTKTTAPSAPKQPSQRKTSPRAK
jgi:hypothetical protein